jgi:hypothetical protein
LETARSFTYLIDILESGKARATCRDPLRRYCKSFAKQDLILKQKINQRTLMAVDNESIREINRKVIMPSFTGRRMVRSPRVCKIYPLLQQRC